MDNAQHGENPMNTKDVINLARKHLGNGADMDSSARQCVADAVTLEAEGKLEFAKRRALRALSYSVGISHADYRRAAK